MRKYDLKVDWCPICDQGWLEISVLVDSGKFILLCGECNSIWESPKNITKENCSNKEYGSVRSPTLAEIEQSGWGNYILKDKHSDLTQNDQEMVIEVGDTVRFTPKSADLGWYQVPEAFGVKIGEEGIVTRIHKHEYVYFGEDKGGWHRSLYTIVKKRPK